MAESIEGFSPSHGVIATADTPGNEALYVTPEQLTILFGMDCGVEVLRHAQALIDAYCHRRSIWPCPYAETLTIAEGRQAALLHITPIWHITSIKGSYMPSRRHRQHLQGLSLDLMLLSGMAGGGQTWAAIPVNQVEWDAATGELWIPSGMMLMPYTQVRVEYLAGYPQIPDVIKNAVASLVNSIQTRGISSRVKHQMGKVVSEYSDASFFTEEVKIMLEPFVVRGLH